MLLCLVCETHLIVELNINCVDCKSMRSILKLKCSSVIIYNSVPFILINSIYVNIILSSHYIEFRNVA